MLILDSRGIGGLFFVAQPGLPHLGILNLRNIKGSFFPDVEKFI